MHLLTLGGSGFLSTAVVDEALGRGHQVTAVTRGRRGGVPDGAAHVQADRDDAEALRAAVDGLPSAPDAVVDVCGYTVAGAQAAADVLAAVPTYVYVSSISAYRDWPPGPVPDESAPTFPEGTDYGPMKAESERVLSASRDGQVLLARAGLIVGPGDRTRRFTAWMHRFATQDRVVVPDDLDRPMAVVDARDLAAFLVDAAEQGWTGPVNATGPEGMTTFGGMLEACRDAVLRDEGRAGEAVVVPEERLLAAGVQPWTDLPLWMPRDVAATAWQVGTARARELGLASRPVEESAADTWRWVVRTGFDHPEPPAAVERVLTEG